MEEAKITRTLEYINDCVRNNYRHDPTYTERKIRNPFKVALKIYSDIPDDIEMKQTLKSELDTIADELGNQPPKCGEWFGFGSEIRLLDTFPQLPCPRGLKLDSIDLREN